MLRSVSLLVLAALLGVPGLGHALTVRCASNVTQLSAALSEATASSDSVFLIRLHTGTYNAAVAAAAFKLEPGTLAGQVVELSGGWSGANGSCQSNDTGITGTVLLGTASYPALQVKSGTAGGTVSVHDLTLRNNNNYVGAEVGACLRGVVSPTGTAIVERVQMEQCVTQGNGNVGASTIYNNAGTLTMRDVVVRNSRGPSLGGLQVNTAGGGVSRLSQLSITGNESVDAGAAAAGLQMQNDATGITYLTNSVVWGNDADVGTADIFAANGQLNFTRVHYTSLKGTPSANNAPSYGDPGFVAPGNPRLRSDSILADSGLSNPQGGSGAFDADGNTRSQGDGIDVGAFEVNPDVIFTAGFE